MEREELYNKIYAGYRISCEEAVWAYDNIPLFELSVLALDRKRKLSGEDIYYNKNFHIEPTNICLYHCEFCSYRKGQGDDDSWNFSLDDIAEYTKQRLTPTTTEVHLVGGVHPDHTFEHYIDIISTVRAIVGSKVSIKAFSAVEHICMIERAGLTYEEGILRLKEAGMDTITGGGAEIFDEEIRSKICPDKASSDKWLLFHETAHRLGIKSTATMLYGHIENLTHRFNHLECLRMLQDMTGGFTAFIPLKYRSRNNRMSSVGESSIIDDMKMIALSRIFLDNVEHIKAYSPMYGRERTQQAIIFGADDIDGTVKDSTKIYSMAGVEERGMDEEDMRLLIREVGFEPVERDTFYGRIN